MPKKSLPLTTLPQCVLQSHVRVLVVTIPELIHTHDTCIAEWLWFSILMCACVRRLDMPGCLAHCCSRLVNNDVEAFSIAAINRVLSDLPSCLDCHPGRSRLLQFATDRLLQLFGDTEAVCCALGDPSVALAVQLQQLSQPAVLALLRSPHLLAHSENTVLLMVAAWAVGSSGSGCSAAETREVVESLCLGQLSQAFTFSALWQLPWLRLTSNEQAFLAQFAAVGLMGNRSGTPGVYDSDNCVGPATWYSHPFRKACPKSAGAYANAWEIPQAELAEMLRALTVDPNSYQHSPMLHWNGFSSTLCLLRDDDEIVHFCILVKARRFCNNACDELQCKHIMSAGSLKVLGPRCMRASWDVATTSTRYISPIVVQGGKVTLDMASWAPYLVAGKVSVHMTLTSCYKKAPCLQKLLGAGLCICHCSLCPTHSTFLLHLGGFAAISWE